MRVSVQKVTEKFIANLIHEEQGETDVFAGYVIHVLKVTF